jgi:hypothetical protein
MNASTIVTDSESIVSSIYANGLKPRDVGSRRTLVWMSVVRGVWAMGRCVLNAWWLEGVVLMEWAVAFGSGVARAMAACCLYAWITPA